MIFLKYFILCFFSYILGCASPAQKQEVLIPFSQPGIALPGYTKNLSFEWSTWPEYPLLEEKIEKNLQDCIQKQYSDIAFIPPSKPEDIILTCNFSAFVIVEKKMPSQSNLTNNSPIFEEKGKKLFLQFSVNLALLSLERQKIAEQKVQLSCPFIKQNIQQEIYVSFCSWFEKHLGPRKSYRKIAVYQEQQEILPFLLQGEIDKAIYKMNSDIDFLLETAKKKSLLQKQAIRLARLFEIRSVLLSLLGYKKASERDQKRHLYLQSIE